MELVADSCCP